MTREAFFTQQMEQLESKEYHWLFIVGKLLSLSKPVHFPL